MSESPIVIVGGGHAAAQLCALLAEAGQGARIDLVCGEPHWPYQRPPLSKSYLKNLEEPLLVHRAQDWYDKAGIKVHLGDPVVAIDRTSKSVTRQSGATMSYGVLVLATGARARVIGALPSSLSNVHALRHAQDANGLRQVLRPGLRMAVLGGGFIGLEVAASARALGLEVDVIESQERLLGRSVSSIVAAHVLRHHEAAGIAIHLAARCDGFEFNGDRLEAIHINGQKKAVDLLLLGIGAEPETDLAKSAGLAVANGVVVDAFMRTDDPAIFAMGDCANFPCQHSGARIRLESVQNANDQARTVLSSIIGEGIPYAPVPWFWSDQDKLRLQMVGLVPAQGSHVTRPGPREGSFSLFHYEGERLMCVESVNSPADFMAARKLMEAGKNPAPELVASSQTVLKSLL